MECYSCKSQGFNNINEVFICNNCNYIQKRCSCGNIIPIEVKYCSYCGEETTNILLKNRFSQPAKITKKLELLDIDQDFMRSDTTLIPYIDYLILIERNGKYLAYDLRDNTSKKGSFEIFEPIKKVDYNKHYLYLHYGRNLGQVEWNFILYDKVKIVNIHSDVLDFLCDIVDNSLYIQTSEMIISSKIFGNELSESQAKYSKIFFSKNYIFAFKQVNGSNIEFYILDKANVTNILVNGFPIMGAGDENLSLLNIMFKCSEREFAFTFKTKTLFLGNIKKFINNNYTLKREKNIPTTDICFTADKLITESNQELQIWENLTKVSKLYNFQSTKDSMTLSFDKRIICFPTIIDRRNFLIYVDQNGTQLEKIELHSPRVLYSHNLFNNIIVLDFERNKLFYYITGNEHHKDN